MNAHPEAPIKFAPLGSVALATLDNNPLLVLITTVYTCNVPVGVAPDVPEEPVNPLVAAVPLEPEVPEVPTVPDVPAVPVKPLVPEVPVNPDVPSAPLIPLVALVPLDPLIPEEPLEPLIPLEPLVPELPEVPEEPSPPLAPSKLTIQEAYVPDPTVRVGVSNNNIPVLLS